MGWLEHAPIWLIGLALMAVLLIAHEVGFLLSRRTTGKAPRRHKTDYRDDTTGYLVSSALALLALLMAFTFSAAQDRFRLRQDLVVAEANAIGTTYLRIQMLDEPWRAQLSRQMLAYTEVREQFARTATPAEIELNARQSADLQDGIWATLTGAISANSGHALNLGLLESTNESFDLAASRRAAREMRVPLPIVRSLIFCSLTVAAVVGTVSAQERRHSGLLLGMLLLLTLAFCLILDLDRPVTGRVQVSQAPMLHALAAIRRSEALKRP